MLNKKHIYTATLLIFLLSFLTHNIYNIFPNFITSLFFPVNESIWEHTKMIFTTWLIFLPIEYYYLKKLNYKNILTSIFISIISNIVLLLIIFTPIYFLMNKQDNIILTLFIYIITIYISMNINYCILQNKKIKFNLISLILIIILELFYSILTYYPLKNPLFYDYLNNKYGITKELSIDNS